MNGRAARAFPTRRFGATRISQALVSDLLEQGREGVIESIHRSAVNVRWRGGLFTLAHESVGGLPNGLLLHPAIALDQIGLSAGMAVRTEGAAIRVPDASVVILLAGATPWSPTMPVVPRLPVATRRSRARRAFLVAADQAPRIGLGALLFGLAGGPGPVGELGTTSAARLVEIIDALGGGKADHAANAAFPLIGLGPGATPSGDDLLLGLEAGLTISAHLLARPFAVGVARLAVGRTTSVAEAFLVHAARFEFAERVHRAALGVLDPDEARMRDAVTTALAWGASSGADMMVGLLAGIQIDAPDLRRRLRACAGERAVAA